MSKKYVLMFEPLPGGFKYGFPRAIPEHGVLGKDHDLFVSPKFDLAEFAATHGYPIEHLGKWKTWVEQVDVDYDFDTYQGGVESFGVYPGSCSQE